MDVHRSAILSWPVYNCQGKTIQELRHSLLYTAWELEQTKLAVQEELKTRDVELAHLENLLTKTIQERDDLHAKYQTLLFELNLLTQQQQQQQHQFLQNPPISGGSSINEDHPKTVIDQTNSNNGFSSSDCEGSIVSSPPPPPPPPRQPTMELVVPDQKPLPEKGRLLEAVMKAGPLLQNLLLAGPLPEWRHPPPPLNSYEIPPVNIPSPPPPPQLPQVLLHNQDSSLVMFNASNGHNRKRVLCTDGFDSPTETKNRRLILSSPMSNSPN